MQDVVPQHIHEFLKVLLLNSLQTIISRFFRNLWSPRSPDLNPCNFWLWGHLKRSAYLGGVVTLYDLERFIILQLRNITIDQLRSSGEHTVHHLESLQINGDCFGPSFAKSSWTQLTTAPFVQIHPNMFLFLQIEFFKQNVAVLFPLHLHNVVRWQSDQKVVNQCQYC